jgi:hypothetical protein
VDDDAGGVDDRAQARRAGGQRGDGVVGNLVGFELADAGTLLSLSNNVFHQRAAEQSLRLDEPRVGE